MGFDLEQMIKALRDILAKDQKAAKTIKQLINELDSWEMYAKDCGIIPTTERPKK